VSQASLDIEDQLGPPFGLDTFYRKPVDTLRRGGDGTVRNNEELLAPDRSTVPEGAESVGNRPLRADVETRGFGVKAQDELRHS
jgi:hypothetical protein